MFIVSFTTPRVQTIDDPVAFELRVRRWLTYREAENAYLFGVLADLLRKGRDPNLRMFVIEDDATLLLAGARLPSGCLTTSWANHELAELVVDYAVNNRWQIASTWAPGHTSWLLANSYATRTCQTFEINRSERVYQLAASTYPFPSQGRLEPASSADRPLARQWLEAFTRECDFEIPSGSIDDLTSTLLPQSLYFWKNPYPVSMAASVAPTPNGASINFVYTPPEFRGKGYAKAATSALASRMLAGGLKYCFILTDIHDARANHLYQSIGAKTVSEIQRLIIRPVSPAPAAPSPDAHLQAGALA